MRDDCSQIGDLGDVLASVTGTKPQSGEYSSFVIYPANGYSMCPGSDTCIWYSTALRPEFQRLRAVAQKLIAKARMGDSSRFADAALFAHAITKPEKEPIEKFRRILETAITCDVSQFFIVPSPGFFEVWGQPKVEPRMSIGHVRFGPFLHAPFSDDLLSTAQYRIAKTGIRGEQLHTLEARRGSICVAREPRSISVFDFDRLNIKGHSQLELDLLNYYFDDVADYWFEEFWREHLECQVTFAASGADVLDRKTLYGLPGYIELSVYLGLCVNGHNGTVSMIEETRHLHSSVSMRFYNFTQDCKKIKDRWAIELGAQSEPVKMFACVVNLARYIARSREMKLRGCLDEAFVLLITGLEALMSDGPDSITSTISRRIAIIVSLTAGSVCEATKKDLTKLYSARSRFVHGGVTIDPTLLPALEEICEQVYFTALRSQTSSQAGSNEDWRSRWLALLDYLYGTSCVGLPPEGSALSESGIRMASAPPIADGVSQYRHGKMRQECRLGRLT